MRTTTIFEDANKMLKQFEEGAFEFVNPKECDLIALEKEEKARLDLQMQGRYSKSTMMSVLESYFFKKEISGICYYLANETCIFEPCTDNPNISQLKSLKEVMAELDLANIKRFIFALAEEQAYVSAGGAGVFMNLPLLNTLNSSRNHWVTLHYDVERGLATLIDSRPEYLSTCYNHEPIKQALGAALAAKGFSLLGFKCVYQGLQHDDIHCGAWTVANIVALVNGKPPLELMHQKSIQEIIDEQREQVEDNESTDLGDGTWRDVDEEEIAAAPKKIAEAYQLGFDHLCTMLELFANHRLSHQEFLDYQKTINDLIATIKAANQKFVQAKTVDEQHQQLSEFIITCEQQFKLLEIKFKSKADVFTMVKTFFSALTGVLLAILGSVLTLGVASYYVLSHKDLCEKYLDIFFRPESYKVSEMKKEWQLLNAKDTLIGERGLLKGPVFKA